MKTSFSVIDRLFYAAPTKGFHTHLKKMVSHTSTDEIPNYSPAKMTELLLFNLEKGNIKLFEENFGIVERNHIKLTPDDLNKIMNVIHRKNPLILNRIYEYAVEEDMKLNPLNYHFFINSYVDTNKFMKAYSIFIQSNFEQVLLDKSTLFNLCSGLRHLKNKEPYKGVIENIIQNNYDTQTNKIISSYFEYFMKEAKKKNFQEDNNCKKREKQRR